MEAGKIVVLGRGYLGERIAAHLGSEVVQVDITDTAEVTRVLSELSPKVVINTAAKTLTKELELPDNQDQAYKVNVQAVANLAVLAKKYNFHLIHFSTTMFFDGSGPEGKGWQEDHIPHTLPSSYYGMTKVWADFQLMPFLNDCHVSILRIATPLSAVEHQRNLLTKFKNFSSVTTDQNSVTVVEDLLKVISVVIEKGPVGVLNAVNPGTISFLEITEAMKRAGIIEVSKEITGITTAQLNTTNSVTQTAPVMNTSKLESLISIDDIHTAVEKACTNYHA